MIKRNSLLLLPFLVYPVAFGVDPKLPAEKSPLSEITQMPSQGIPVPENAPQSPVPPSPIAPEAEISRPNAREIKEAPAQSPSSENVSVPIAPPSVVANETEISRPSEAETKDTTAAQALPRVSEEAPEPPRPATVIEPKPAIPSQEENIKNASDALQQVVSNVTEYVPAPAESAPLMTPTQETILSEPGKPTAERPLLLPALTSAQEITETVTEEIQPSTTEPISTGPVLEMEQEGDASEFREPVSLLEEQVSVEKKQITRQPRGKRSNGQAETMATMADIALSPTPPLTKTEEREESEEAIRKLTKSGAIHLGQYLEPWKGSDPDERVEMNFDNKEISELLKFLSETLDITFILDDYIEPVRADGLQPLAGTRITFKSTIPLSLRQAWEIGLTFLEMAGFSIIPATQPRTYRVTVSASRDKTSANREPLPTFIGIDPELLPDTDAKIRYVYFAENADIATIIQIIEGMKSGSAGPLIEVAPLRAVIITDKAANIRSMMMILKEIDKVTLPETLAIIRLKHTDAKDVRELYNSLVGKDPKNPVFNPFTRQRKPATTQYFSEATRVFEEPHTNSLIVLGTRENIKRFEEFIVKYIDTSLDIHFSPLYTVQLRFVDAGSIAKILNEVIQRFNAHPANSAAALVGGVRDGNKFFKPTVRITEEPFGNRLIINADYEEYLKLLEIINKLDVEQPQVAIKMLILNVDLTNRAELGVQLRNSVGCSDGNGGIQSILGNDVNFQTSMIGGIVTNPPAGSSIADPVNGAQRLLGNLIRLADRVDGISAFDIGTTLVTLGRDMFGFWGLLRVLELYTRTSVVANPFFTATHKYKTEFKVGETRRTATAIVTGQRETQAQGDLSADLRVVITPQISLDDVELNVYVELGQFVDASTQDRIVRKFSTRSLLANKEVLAIGGLIRDRTIVTVQKVPVLGDIPLIGWLFKSEAKSVERTSLVILICPEIIKAHVAEAFTFDKITAAKETLYSMRNRARDRDPIHRWFFNDHKEKEASYIDKFVSTQQRYIDESQRKQEVFAMANPDKKDKATLEKRSKKSLLDLIDNQIGALA